MKNYIFTDLAEESDPLLFKRTQRLPEYTERIEGNIRINKLTLSTDSLAKKYRKSKGTYITVNCGPIHLMSESETENAARIIGQELQKMLCESTGMKITKDFKILAVGLGNSEITSDSLGPKSTSKLSVTRHIQSITPELFDSLDMCSLCALSPGVLSQTGIETVEIIKGSVESIKPDAVIAIDSLASRSIKRLASGVQISNSGINPGSGIGNMRKAVNKENLGVPVIAVGVPTVISSSTIIYDALKKANIEKYTDELIETLENGKEFFVSPKEIDVIVNCVSSLIARAFEFALCVNGIFHKKGE